MKKLRILSLILIILILAVFILMSGALFMGKNDLFFICGSVLIALLILGYVILRWRKAILSREQEPEEAGNADDGPAAAEEKIAPENEQKEN